MIILRLFWAITEGYGPFMKLQVCRDVEYMQFIDSQWRTNHLLLSNHPEMVKHGNLIGSINQIKQMLSDLKDTIDSSAILLSVCVWKIKKEFSYASEFCFR